MPDDNNPPTASHDEPDTTPADEQLNDIAKELHQRLSQPPASEQDTTAITTALDKAFLIGAKTTENMLLNMTLGAILNHQPPADPPTLAETLQAADTWARQHSHDHDDDVR
jgi:hypothetical protein